MKKNLKLTTLMAGSVVAIFILLMFAVEPMYSYVTTDITLAVTPLPYILDMLRNLCEIGAFAVSFALIIFASVKCSPTKAWTLFAIYCAACVARRGGLMLIYLFMHALDDYGLFNMLFSLCLECIIALIVTVMSVMGGKAFREGDKKTRKAARRSGDFSSVREVSFSSVFSKYNPYLVCALKATAVMVVITVGRRIISDILYGAPTRAAEVLIMAVYYLFDLLMCTLFYAIVWLINSKLYARQDSSL